MNAPGRKPRSRRSLRMVPGSSTRYRAMCRIATGSASWRLAAARLQPAIVRCAKSAAQGTNASPLGRRGPAGQRRGWLAGRGRGVFAVRPEFPGHVVADVRAEPDAAAHQPRADSRRRGRLPRAGDQPRAEVTGDPPDGHRLPCPVRARDDKSALHRVFHARPGPLQTGWVVPQILMVPGADAQLDHTLDRMLAQARCEPLAETGRSPTPFSRAVPRLADAGRDGRAGDSPRAGQLLAVALHVLAGGREGRSRQRKNENSHAKRPHKRVPAAWQSTHDASDRSSPPRVMLFTQRARRVCHRTLARRYCFGGSGLGTSASGSDVTGAVRSTTTSKCETSAASAPTAARTGASTAPTAATVSGISMKVWPCSSLIMMRRTLPS